jgi:hypothetical protein
MLGAFLWTRGRAAWTLVVIAAFVSGLSIADAMSESPAMNDISPLVKTLPNYLLASPGHGLLTTTIQVDAKNHLLYELSVGNGACPTGAVVDSDTYLPRSKLGKPSAGGTCSGSDKIVGGQQVSNSKTPVSAVDSTDKLLFISDYVGIHVYSVDPVRQVALWNGPSDPLKPFPLDHQIYSTVVGLSWSAQDDELIITTAGANTSNSGDPPGLAVSAYSIPRAVRDGSGNPVACQCQLWTVDLSQRCGHELPAKFGGSAAVKSEHTPYVFVPCALVGDQWNSEFHIAGKEGIIKLNPTDSTMLEAVAPGVVRDFFFDPGSDRGVLPTTFPTPGYPQATDVLVYDGGRNEFVDRTHVAPDTAVTFGLDTQTGRLYAVGHTGLAVVDVRRTPVTNQRFPQVVDSAAATEVAVGIIGSDPEHHFARMPVPHLNGNDLPYFDVYADTVPLSQDPPKNDADRNTQATGQGSVHISYSATARGYGTHIDHVGGPGALDDNLLNIVGAANQVPAQLHGANLPFGQGNRDLLAAEVADLSIRDGAATGAASALNKDAKTEADFRNQPPPPKKPANEIWPYPSAECSSIGGNNKDQEWSGLYRGTDPNSPSQIPETGSQADAKVQCLIGEGTPAGSAMQTGFNVSGSFPNLGFGSSNSQTDVMPPSGARGATAHTTSYSRGIEIDLAKGADGKTSGLFIGEVWAEATAEAGGVKGSAHASYLRKVSNVSLRVKGVERSVCGATCSNADLQQVNDQFPTLLHITLPSPDDSYFHGKDDGKAAEGSPGGYLAAVEANQFERDGDQQFNGMSTEESSYQPAMRIVVYSPQDGGPSLSRVVVDLAGVQDEARLARTYLNPIKDKALTDMGQAAEAAGIPTTTTTGGGGARSKDPGAAISDGLWGILEKFLEGLRALARSPREAVEMAAFLTLLLLPMIVMARRQTWLSQLLRGPAE